MYGRALTCSGPQDLILRRQEARRGGVVGFCQKGETVLQYHELHASIDLRPDVAKGAERREDQFQQCSDSQYHE